MDRGSSRLTSSQSSLDPEIWERAVVQHHLLSEGWPLVLNLNARQLAHLDEKGYGDTLREAVHRYLDIRLEQWAAIIAGLKSPAIEGDKTEIGENMFVEQTRQGDIVFHWQKVEAGLKGNQLRLPMHIPAAMAGAMIGQSVSSVVVGVDALVGESRTITGHAVTAEGLSVLELEPEPLRDISYRDLFGNPAMRSTGRKKAA